MLQAGGSKALLRELAVCREAWAALFGKSLREVFRDKPGEVGKGHL